MMEQNNKKSGSANAEWKPEPDSWVDRLLGAVKLSGEDQEKFYEEIWEEEITQKFG